MKVKELDRTVNIAWSPVQQQPVLLAAGTAAQQLDASFSTSAAVEIYGLNLGEPGLDLELKASMPSQFRFHRITWGGWGFSRDNPCGVIVGGCDGGHLQVYNVSRLLAGEESLIVSKDSHTGPVRAIDFNSYQTNILATGASDSEIFIWDLNNTTTPMSPGAKSQPNEDVLWVAWNKQVQHILASTFAARCVIFDLRKNEPIIKLSDNTSRVRWKVVEWHPAVATQLCLASEDDSNPVVQLWDLRFATTPIKTLEGHSKGLLSIAWCPQDPDLLIGSGKDNKILCWNPNANEPGGEVVCEIVTSYQWNFEVAWCPRNPSLVASCSFDGHASIHSLTGGQQQVQTSKKIADSFPGMEQYADAPPVQPPVHGQLHSAPELRKAPKWLRRPVGASFGFGGKLVIFNSESRSVIVSQVVSEPVLLERSHSLQVALASGRFDEICSNKTDSVWPYVAASLQQSPRAAVKKLLGFSPDNLELNKYMGEPANARLKGDMEQITDGLGNLGQGGRDDFDTFSNSAGSTNGINYASNNTSAFDNFGLNQNSLDKKKSASFVIPTGDDVDGMISKALLAGNIEVAVELCVQKNRMADAIILAMTAGSDLLAKTQHRYFLQSKGHLSELIGAVVTEEWSHVVSSCNLSSWKEALAAVLTYSKDEELPSLCETLGQRLEMEGGEGIVNAEICYVIARNLSQLIKLRTKQSPNLPTEKLQELVEMVVVLQRGVRVDGGDGESETAKLMSRYAELLAAQGELATALSYLHDPQQENLIELHDRLQYALGQKQTYVQKPQPAAPYYHTQTQSIFNRRSSTQSVGGSWPLSTSGLISQPNTPPANVPKPTPFSQMYHQPSQVVQPPQAPPSKPLASQQSPFSPVVTQSPYNPLINQPPTMTGNSAPLPPPPSTVNVPPLVPAPLQPQHQPSIFNPPSSFPSQSQPPFNPPGSVAGPPPPPTSAVPPAPLHRSSPSPGPGIQQGRQKYVIDPSVNAGPPGLSYRNQIPPGPMFQQPQLPQSTPAPNMAPLPQQEQTYNPAEFRSQAYAPQQTGPAGWNDPPMVSSPPRNQPKVEMPPQNPITHPLYGVVPEANQMNTFHSQMAGGAVNGGYGDPPPVMQQQNQLQQQQYQTMSYSHPPKPVQPTAAPASSGPTLTKAPEPPQPKLPIPEEHIYLQTVFDELRNRCSCAANNPQSKRKLEEVARKLEMLYDALRESKLSPGTLTGLHQLVQLVQTGDYTGGLALHTQLISGPDFSQIASFMPGLKVLLQSALQLGVYLQ